MVAYYDSGTSSTAVYTNCVNPYYTASTTYSTQATNTFFWISAVSSTDGYGLQSLIDALDGRQRKFDNDNAPAAARARELLLAMLSEEQRQSFEEHSWFVVQGGKSGTSYRIRNEGSICANVEVLADNDNDRVLYKLCAHCEPASVPTCDQLLAQKIKIEFDESEFLRTANRHAA